MPLSVPPSQLPAPGAGPFQAKGLAYRGVVRHLEETYGREVVRERCHDARLREFLSQPFLAASWYDVFPIVPLCFIGADLEGVSFLEFCESSARRQAREDIHGVYRAILAVVSPSLAIRAVIKITHRYFSFGEASIVEMGQRECLATRTAVPAYIYDWYTVVARAYIEAVLDAAGAQRVDVRVARGERDRVQGHEVVAQTYRIHWT